MLFLEIEQFQKFDDFRNCERASHKTNGKRIFVNLAKNLGMDSFWCVNEKSQWAGTQSRNRRFF